ncbi:hypothetical protein FZI91_15635 [Mycobacterium sp. CBMA271]|uniref:hypothetical protein n=1 Tax=unclassified Mycobacteroides TaxID=2618759 RepID=UPI0012DC034A|nr:MULTISPECIES: hypothetical protein [unclassified Mycobacteroides]MUM17599.1 hypothetical protein [Mycobacteroides sp. CBMA 326]MUM23128.1 hypothetical protein [Mycobacteroides sp. CBMA 271]
MNGDLIKVVDLNPQTHDADLRQAQYFHDLLGEQRAVAWRELANHIASLERRQQRGKPSSHARLQRLIGAKRSEVVVLDQLMCALNDRFPISLVAQSDNGEYPVRISG